VGNSIKKTAVLHRSTFFLSLTQTFMDFFMVVSWLFYISAQSPLEYYVQYHVIYHKTFCTHTNNYSCTPTKCDFLLKYAKYMSIMKPTCLPLPQSWSPTPGTLSQKLLLYNMNYYKALIMNVRSLHFMLFYCQAI